jgi:hypothetical protein
MNILEIFNISKQEQKIIESFQNSIKYHYIYRTNSTEENFEKTINIMKNNINELINISTNQNIKDDYAKFLNENIENKQMIFNILYTFEKRLLIDTNIVYKLLSTMIMENIQLLLKSFTIYLLINVVLILPLLYFFDMKFNIYLWIFIMFLFFIPSEMITIRFLIGNFKMLNDLKNEGVYNDRK